MKYFLVRFEWESPSGGAPEAEDWEVDEVGTETFDTLRRAKAAARKWMKANPNNACKIYEHRGMTYTEEGRLVEDLGKLLDEEG